MCEICLSLVTDQLAVARRCKYVAASLEELCVDELPSEIGFSVEAMKGAVGKFMSAVKLGQEKSIARSGGLAVSAIATLISALKGWEAVTSTTRQRCLCVVIASEGLSEEITQVLSNARQPSILNFTCAEEAQDNEQRELKRKRLLPA